MSFCETCRIKWGGFPAMNEADARLHLDNNSDHELVNVNEEDFGVEG